MSAVVLHKVCTSVPFRCHSLRFEVHCAWYVLLGNSSHVSGKKEGWCIYNLIYAAAFRLIIYTSMLKWSYRDMAAYFNNYLRTVVKKPPRITSFANLVICRCNLDHRRVMALTSFSNNMSICVLYTWLYHFHNNTLYYIQICLFLTISRLKWLGTF